ncbi:hypothetical protein BP5796_12334 [Coleophoma crateriformis]|uniref:Uncharacterized protein n=2 Tax=Coleophoma TaxID=453209 RepID=A0A3D8Q479_9HELO|nr:hypothetical protein BP6252_14051 [Coleophoma cylindrospora]RDW58404.1 hypothetical protein BP5796_12334 [Coleophoma crateriformis]
MKFLSTLVSIAALTSVVSANTCNQIIANSGFISSYSILTDGTVPDIPGICGGLWDNLKHFSDCIGVSASTCESYQADPGRLLWKFENGANCNAGMVESAWWEATKNQWGSITC